MHILKRIQNKMEDMPIGFSTPIFMVLAGLVSVRISLNFIVMYAWNTTGFLPNWNSKGLLESGTFRPQTISPLVVSLPRRFPPGRFPPSRYAPLVVSPSTQFAPSIYMEEGSGEFAINQ